MAYPYEFSKSQMQKVGVILLNEGQHQLQCAQCHTVWQVIKRGLRFPKGYWKCPNGCNSKPFEPEA